MAIAAIGFSCRRASFTALRRNSGGLAAGFQDFSPEAIIVKDQVFRKPGQAPWELKVGCRSFEAS